MHSRTYSCAPNIKRRAPPYQLPLASSSHSLARIASLAWSIGFFKGIKMTSLAKLTSQSTQTLSLLLERQRLQTISSGPNNLHLPQITRNLNQLRTGILELESKEGGSEASRLLKNVRHIRRRLITTWYEYKITMLDLTTSGRLNYRHAHSSGQSRLLVD